MITFEEIGVAGARENLTTAAAIGITSTIVAPTSGDFAKQQAKAALVTVETASINFTLDGTTPTTTATTNIGHTMTSGQSYTILGKQNVSNFKCINSVASSGAFVKVTVFF